jgi:uncharacterized protein
MTILDVYVQPGASRSGFAGMHGDRMKIRLAAPPVDGRANEALVEFLAEFFGVPRRHVRIAAGLKSRRKRVIVEGAKGDMPWKTPSR